MQSAWLYAHVPAGHTAHTEDEVQMLPDEQLPQVPPQPSLPHVFPAQDGVQTVGRHPEQRPHGKDHGSRMDVTPRVLRDDRVYDDTLISPMSTARPAAA